MRTVAIIQARTGSSRLPGKVLMKLDGRTVLEWVVERTRKAKSIDNVCIATTTEPKDSAICETAARLRTPFYRGSEKDVLQRFCEAAQSMHMSETDLIVRITADCPFIDPEITDATIKYHKKHKFDYTNNVVTNAYFPRGFDTEVFSFGLLKKINKNANTAYDREHVTTYIRNNTEKFSIGFYKAKGIFRRPDIKVCIDTPEDFKRAQMIVDFLGEKKISAKNIIKLFKKPSIAIIGEGSEKTGTGHIIRPLKLLEYITDMLDCEICFFTNDNALIRRIKSAGCKTRICDVAKTKGEKMKLIKQVSAEGFDIIIIDMYEIFREDVKSLGDRIFCIEENYTSPEKAILSRAFDSAKKSAARKEAKKILITFGGSDPYNITMTALVPLLKTCCKIDVVLGGMFKHADEISKTCRSYKNVRTFQSIKNMALLMSKADIAVCNGGTTMYELCYLGVPCIVVCNTEYEKKGADDMQERGAVINLGMHNTVKSADIYSAVMKLMDNHSMRKKMNNSGIFCVKNTTPTFSKEIVRSIIPN